MWGLLAELFGVFFFIGLFCFGGGYAIIPLIQEAVVSHQWLSAQEFINIIAVSESTPGPISINTATFVGFKLQGLLGAAVATLGLCLPAFFIVVWVSKLLSTAGGKAFLARIMIGIRPVVVGLIFTAAMAIAQTVLVTHEAGGTWQIHYGAVILALLSFVAISKFKVHPIILITGAALLGIVL